MSPIAAMIGCVAAVLLAHCLFSLYLMLYAWDEPGRLRPAGAPATPVEPELSITVLLPARNEEAVIGDTIARLSRADYPRELLEIVVICQADDELTIAAAERQIEGLDPGQHVWLVVYDRPPFNKPHALSEGYRQASHDVIAVFDAEDDVHPEIFSLANAVMVEQRVGVVQAGVQLMNIRDHWFAPFNCLEYFYYYRSRMLFNARVGMVPLGGNTVFIDRRLIDKVGGWDISCLTEDADLGLRISALGERVAVVCDSRRATREETPHTMGQFIRQRTRWHQGFLQILSRGVWLRLPGWRQRLLAFVTLGQPIIDAMLLVYVALLPVSLIWLRLPVVIAVLTFLPLYGVALQLVVNLVGITRFGRCYEQRIPVWMRLAMPFTFLPFQWMIGFSALRAVVRHAAKNGEWEKTEHHGAHRRLDVTQPHALAGTANVSVSATSPLPDNS